MANLQCLYGKPSYQDLDAALLRLNKPMNRLQPVGVTLRKIKEIQLFLLANLKKYCALTELNPISCALIKLTKQGVCMQTVMRNEKNGTHRIVENGPNFSPHEIGL